jgi:3,4-dihydroxy 2-butanone 4-phosphate synthase/GTP cyclohydrolase II
MKFTEIKQVIQSIKEGSFVIVVDDDTEEAKAHLILAAQKIDDEKLGFFKQVGMNTLHVAMEASKLIDLGFKASYDDNRYQVVNTVSVDAKSTKDGASLEEQLVTIKKFLDGNASLSDFRQPGHIYITQSSFGGVLKRAGHIETVVDLARLAGFQALGLISEIADEDGKLIQGVDLESFAQKYQFPIVKVEDLISYRRQSESMVKRASTAKMPTRYGEFTIVGYENILNNEHHVALIKGDVSDGNSVLIRVHSECLTGDAFGSLRCDCGQQFDAAMKKIEEEGRGVLLYMRQEGRGIGLINKIRAYNLQDQGLDTVEANVALGFGADMRDYGIGAEILADLKVNKLRLMTNNPRKLVGLSGYGIEIVERVPIQLNHNEKNEDYLKTKQSKLSHMLKFEE